MNRDENKICRLCLNTCNENFETIQNVNKGMLEILLVNMDFVISDECVKCKKCTDMLQKCFEFKSISLHTEDKLIAFLESRNITSASMTQVYLEDMQNKKINHSNITEICRFCMKPTTTYFDLDEIVDEYFRVMLQKFLPEVTLCFSNNPISCSNCLDTLKSYLTFLKNLQLVEEHIKAYCETEYEKKCRKVELNNMQSILKTILTEKIFIEEQSVEIYFSGLITKNCVKNQSKIRSVPLEKATEEPSNSGNDCLEISKKDDCVQNYIKSEEIEIKTDDIVERDDDSENDRNEDTLKKFQCSYCKYESTDKKYLTIHLRSTHGICLLSCHQCRYKTYYEDELKKHQTVHSDNAKFECPQCHKIFERRLAFDSHLLKIHENSYDLITSKIHYCDICGYKTILKANLFRHINVKHSQLEKYQCNYCLLTFHKDFLKIHISSVHSNLKRFICNDCNKIFSQKFHLDRHVVLCHQKNADLMKRVTNKIHNCDHCTYRCVGKENLKNHMKIHKTKN